MMFPPAAKVWQVIWVNADGRGLGACGHRHPSPDEATLCPFEPAGLPDACAGLVRQVRDPEYRTEGQRIREAREAARPRQLELDLGAG